MADGLNGFVHVSNVSKFLRILATDIAPARRSTIRDLLLEEETKLGKTVEQLSNAERWVEEGRARIEVFQRAASDSRFGPEHRQRAESMLVAAHQTQMMLERFRAELGKQLNLIEA